MEVARHVGRLESQRPPELVIGAVEGAARRQDSNHGVRLIVEEQSAIEDRSVASETVLPQHVREHHHTIAAGLVFVRAETCGPLRP